VLGVGAAAIFFVLRHCILCCNDFFVPRHCTSCHGNALCAATMVLAPWQSSSCHGKVLHATAKLFVPRQGFLCHGKALCAMAKLFEPQKSLLCFVPWQQNDALWCCMALFFVLWLMFWQEWMCHSVAWHSAHGKMMLLHSMACCIVQHCYSSCHRQVHLAMASFFVTWQETMCCSILCHCSSFRSKK